SRDWSSDVCSANLLGTTCAAVLLHDVHALDQHAAGLGIHLHHRTLTPLVIATDHANQVALGDDELLALAVYRMALVAQPALALAMLQNSHVRAPPARATRSSCTAFREARAPPVRRCASRAALRR